MSDDWIKKITDAQNAKLKVEQEQTALATERRNKYNAKIRPFWKDILNSLTNSLRTYNNATPARSKVQFSEDRPEVFIVQTNTSPPSRLTIELNVQGQTIRRNQDIRKPMGAPIQKEESFRIDIGDDDALSLRVANGNQLVTNQQEALLKQFLEAL
jgi:hypothetical protein